MECLEERLSKTTFFYCFSKSVVFVTETGQQCSCLFLESPFQITGSFITIFLLAVAHNWLSCSWYIDMIKPLLERIYIIHAIENKQMLRYNLST